MGEIIPRLLFQTWHSRTLPPKMAENVARLQAENPEFAYHFADDAECRAFLEEQYGTTVARAWDDLLPGTFKADLWRLGVLYHYGGVYLDIKYAGCNGFKLRDLLYSENWWAREGMDPLPEEGPCVYTGMMAVRPGNPKIFACLQQLVKNVQNRYYGPGMTSITGPQLLGTFFTQQEMAARPLVYEERLERGPALYYEGADVLAHFPSLVGALPVLLPQELSAQLRRPGHPFYQLLKTYPEYREEQQNYGRTLYWKYAWVYRQVYPPS